MRKILALSLAVILIFLLCGCGGESGKSSSGGKKEENKKVMMESCEIELVKCVFTDKIYGQDPENDGIGFPFSEDRVYVDLVLKVKNTSDENFTKDNISAYFMYQDMQYDMQFEVESASLSGVASNSYILPQKTEFIHLFQRADNAITKENITVVYTVEEKEFKVKPTENTKITKPLDEKIKVKIGDKINADGLYSLEVISCKAVEEFKASNTENSRTYKPFGGSDLQFIDLVLKIKNNTKADLNYIYAYTYIGDEKKVANYSKETKENTAIESLTDAPLTAGEEEYCHLYPVISKSDDTNGLLLRFNLGGVCYYCEVES